MQRFLTKLGSGRLFLVICVGVTFVYCSVHKIITPEAIVTIVMAVMTSYFSRTDRSAKPDTPNNSNPK